MAAERLSHLQRRVIAWLWAEEQRTKGTVAPGHLELAQALGHHRGNLSISLAGLERKGYITVGRTPGGRVEWLYLTNRGLDFAGSSE